MDILGAKRSWPFHTPISYRPCIFLPKIDLGGLIKKLVFGKLAAAAYEVVGCAAQRAGTEDAELIKPRGLKQFSLIYPPDTGDL